MIQISSAQKLLSLFLWPFSSFLLISCASFQQSKIQKPDTEFELQAELPLIADALPPTHFASGDEYAIATQGNASAKAAADIFESGGNIIDAAVAASFAISVERPQSTGLGGGGFLLFHSAKDAKTYAFDFREVAPLRAFEAMYLDANGELNRAASVEGILASGVPGLVAGLYEIHRRFGKLDWSFVLEPAVRLAEHGFEVYPELSEHIESEKELLQKNQAASRVFLKNGKALPQGERLVQKDLAKVLREIQKKGRKGFYSGWVAAAILNEFSRKGGLIEKADFDAYQVKERSPVTGTYHNYRIASMPPPSSGGVHILQMLNILKRADLHEGPGATSNIALTAASMQQAFADRAKHLGDSDFVKVPLKELLSENYARISFARISAEPRTPSKNISGTHFISESNDTTHFSIMDAEGNAVASTQTINGRFGSGIMVPKTGILLNNEMDDFTTKVGASNLYGAVGGEPNKIEPKKRPLSSMSPSIVFDSKTARPVFALGSPSGTRIINCVLLSLLNHLEYGMDLERNQLSLRYHHQWMPDTLFVESPAFPAGVHNELKKLGYEIETKDLGCRVQAVEWDGSQLHSASDPRGEGRALAR